MPFGTRLAIYADHFLALIFLGVWMLVINCHFSPMATSTSRIDDRQIVAYELLDIESQKLCSHLNLSSYSIETSYQQIFLSFIHPLNPHHRRRQDAFVQSVHTPLCQEVSYSLYVSSRPTFPA